MLASPFTKNYRSASDACRLYGVCRVAWHNMVKLGQLPAPTHQIGKRFFYTVDELEQIAERFNLKTRKED